MRTLFDYISDNNPFIINYNENQKENNENQKENNESTNDKQEKEKSLKEEKYEDKYLSKFKIFPNHYQFTEEELKLEIQEYERLKILDEEERFNTINVIRNKLQKINYITKIVSFDNDNLDIFVYNLSDNQKELLLEYFSIVEEDEEDINYKDLTNDLFLEKINLEKELDTIEHSVLDDSELRNKARAYLLKTKHDQLINSYVLEYTPLGNIYMRYNNNKGTFEYFSNNTIPYRYLEPVGRKYVMTFWCKPLFVDLEEELKIAEQKFDEEKIRKEEEERKSKDLKNNKSKDVIAKLKEYNKDSKISNNIKIQAKNRSQQNFVLPPQIKANLPNLNQSSGKQLLKENANRYTWEGRLSNFYPLKKIDKVIVNKNLSLTFADFKRLQANNTK